MQTIDRFRGSLLGLAAGDSLGAPLEGAPPGDGNPAAYQEMAGASPFDVSLAPGQWTDDTSMALCLAASLIEKRDFDPLDQLERYLRWFRTGYMSSVDYSFGIGGTVIKALRCFEETREPFCGSADPLTAGNGCMMRLAPVPLFYARNPREAIERSADSSRTTHGAATCVDACRYLAALIVGALQGTAKDELLSENFSPLPGYWNESPLHADIAAIARGSFRRRNPPEIFASGYVVESLEAALWAFYHSDSFKEGCLKAVCLGSDADTTGAIYGQLAGAFYGESEIPESWREKLARRELIESLADQLYALSSAA
jgi:ADP-ribosyl-[dinitrogen reductase] hydrolase